MLIGQDIRSLGSPRSGIFEFSRIRAAFNGLRMFRCHLSAKMHGVFDR